MHIWDFKGRNEYSREGGIIYYQKRLRIQFIAVNNVNITEE